MFQLEVEFHTHQQFTEREGQKERYSFSRASSFCILSRDFKKQYRISKTMVAFHTGKEYFGEVIG